jgi:hypothetical protein
MWRPIALDFSAQTKACGSGHTFHQTSNQVGEIVYYHHWLEVSHAHASPIVALGSTHEQVADAEICALEVIT